MIFQAIPIIISIFIHSLAPSSSYNDDHDAADVFIDFGIQLLQSGEEEQARKNFLVASVLNPEYFEEMIGSAWKATFTAEFKIERALLSLRRKQRLQYLEESKALILFAYQMFKVIHLTFPERIDGYIGLGKIYILKSIISDKKMEALDKARELLQDALEIDPNNTEAWFYLGQAYNLMSSNLPRQVGMTQTPFMYYELLTQAVKCFQQARKLDPKYHDVVEDLLGQIREEYLRVENSGLEDMGMRLEELGRAARLFEAVVGGGSVKRTLLLEKFDDLIDVDTSS